MAQQQYTLSPLFSDTQPESTETTDTTAIPCVDVVVVGAGVGGLHTAFQLGLQELSAAVIDCLPFAGGQCAQLYPDKPIYDIPGLPHCNGQSLTDSLLRQLQPLDVRWALGTLVQSVECAAPAPAPVIGSEAAGSAHRFTVRTDAGAVQCSAVVLATGVGAFVPRMPKIKGLDRLPAGVLHTELSAVARLPAASAHRSFRTAVLGGDDAAVRAALHLADSGTVPQLVFRRSSPRADSALLQQWNERCEQGRADYVQGIPLAIQPAADAGWMLTVQHADSPAQHIRLDALLVTGGRTPQARKLLHGEQGAQLLEGKHIAVEPTTCATSMAGVYAIGDVAQYPHRNRLIVTAFHEAAQVACAIYRYLRPDAPRPLEYTTSSRRLHRLLKV